MNGKRAKRLRKAVYGDNVTGPSGRSYVQEQSTGAITADKDRRRYQQIKKYGLEGIQVLKP